MKFTGSYQIAAPRQAVWDAINDPEILRQCIPGCEEIVQETPTHWTAKVVAKVGPVRARFAGNIRLEELRPPASSRLVGEGNGGAAGFAKGEARITLAEDGAATVLTYEAEAQIGGKLAQIGSRLIDGFARKYADEFFATFARLVGGEATQPADAGVSREAKPTASHDAPPVVSPVGDTPFAVDAAPLPAPHVASAPPLAAPPAVTLPPPTPRRSFDPQTFTILVLAALLVFMTIMFAMKP